MLTGDMLTEDADPIGVAIDSHNPKAEALLGYLHCGDFGSARAVGRVVTNDAEERLREKRLDPNTAVICGYFSLLASSDEQMHDWLRNLEHWFDFLPDGAVVHAWQALTESTPNFAIARERLLVAAQRGLPTYAFGVRLLYDGLAVLPKEPSKNAMCEMRKLRIGLIESLNTRCALTGVPSRRPFTASIQSNRDACKKANTTLATSLAL